MKLQEWAIDNEPSKDMLFYNGYWNQIIFIRDEINYILFGDKSFEKERSKITVINSHVSKSIKLPVYYLDLKDEYGLDIIMRNNFYDWKISINSSFSINCDFLNIFKENDKISYLHCEGFPTDKVYEMYKDNNKQFTIELSGNYNLYTFMWILKQYLIAR